MWKNQISGGWYIHKPTMIIGISLSVAKQADNVGNDLEDDIISLPV